MTGQEGPKGESGLAKSLRVHKQFNDHDPNESEVEREVKRKHLQDLLSDGTISCSAPSASTLGRNIYANPAARPSIRDTFQSDPSISPTASCGTSGSQKLSGMSSASDAALAFEMERLKKGEMLSSASKYAATVAASSSAPSPTDLRRHASIYRDQSHSSPYATPRATSGESGRARNGSIGSSHPKAVQIGGMAPKPRMPSYNGVYA
jgi:hypothetical protein